MNTSQPNFRRIASRTIGAAVSAVFIASVLFLSSCQTRSTTEPNPARPVDTNSYNVDLFLTPAPNGEVDDYYLLSDSESDSQYSYYLDEQDYQETSNFDQNQSGDNEHHRFNDKFFKEGHKFGRHNRIHEHFRRNDDDHEQIGTRENDWTDSLNLTALEMKSIDTAMTEFRQCIKPEVDSLKSALSGPRATFRTTKLSIIARLDSGKITRDSAYKLFDSAISKYEAESQIARKAFVAEVKVCEGGLDARIRAILTPDQYAIWVRHRGW